VKRDLPKHLYLEGTTYRVKLPTGKRITLGTDRAMALHRFNVLMSNPVHIDAHDPKVISDLWKRHKKGAKQRKLEFCITEYEIATIMETQNNRCAVTDLPFRNDKPEGLRVRPWAASLDRLSGQSGYVAGNVRIVCCFVNVAMNGFGDDFFSTVLEPLIQARVKAQLELVKTT
jgi:hypothetical protein